MENNQDKPLKSIFAVEKEYKTSPEEEYLLQMNSQISDPSTEHNQYGGAGIQGTDEARDSYAYNLFAPDSMKKETKYANAQIADEYASSIAGNLAADVAGGAVGGKIASKIHDKRLKKLLSVIGPDNEKEVQKVVKAYLNNEMSYKECLEKVTKLASDDFSMFNKKRGVYSFKDALKEKKVKTSETLDKWIENASKTDDTWTGKALRMQEAVMPDDLPEHVYGVTRFAQDTMDNPYVAKWLGYENGKIPDDVKEMFIKAAQVHDWGKVGTNFEALNTQLQFRDPFQGKIAEQFGYVGKIKPHPMTSKEYLSMIPEADVPFGLEGDSIKALAEGHHSFSPKTKLQALMVMSDILDARLQKRVYKDGEDPIKVINDFLIEAKKDKWIQEMPEDVKEVFVRSILNSLDEGGYNGALPKSSLSDVYHNNRVDYNQNLDKVLGNGTEEAVSIASGATGANAVWNTAKNVANNLVNEHKTRVNVYDTVQKGFPGVRSSNARKVTGFALDSQGLDHDNNVANFLKEEGLQKCYNYLVRMNENLQNAKVSSAKKEAVQSVVDNWDSLSDADKVYLLRQISKNPMIRKVVNSKDYQW